MKMGLDMYLTGEIYITSDWNNPRNNITEEGYRLKGKLFDLGYWRKHPDLHGFIVTTFADGVDDCQRIHLGPESTKEIILAIKQDRLPHTDGFFFGSSENDSEQKAEAIEIFSKALNWQQTDEWARSIYYQASW